MYIIIVNTMFSVKKQHIFNVQIKVLHNYEDTISFYLKKRLILKTEKTCKMEKNYPINKKIPGAHFQMTSN